MTVVSSAPRNASLDEVIAPGTRRVLDERATVDDKPEVNRAETPGGGPLPQGGGWLAPHGQLAGGRDAHGRSCPFGRHRLVAATDGLSDHRRARGQLRRHSAARRLAGDRAEAGSLSTAGGEARCYGPR